MTERQLLIATGIFHPESGGPATYLYELLPRLQALAWQIQVLTYGHASSHNYPYPVQRIPRRAFPRRQLDYALAARPLLRNADLIYQHTLALPLVGVHSPRIIKIVGDQAWERTIRQGWIPPSEDIDLFQTKSYSGFTAIQQALRSREVRRMDGVIVPSHYLKRMVVGWGVNPDKVQVIYNAMPPETGELDATQAEARARLALDAGPLLLTAARLNPWKGVDHLLQALSAVPDVRLLVAGDGPERPRLESLAEQLQLTARVTFLGHVPREQLAHYRKAADYFVLYSGYEGLSHAILESLNSGTPVIASDKGGNPEVITHGVNGLLVPYINREALTTALIEAFQPGRRDQLAAQSAHGLERFDFETMVSQTAAYLDAFV
ncbi:MAG: glycosyltransferase family 4 protein [Anaerolineae bacterium]|nr:glycosyltransferase family 4 protein [Anaerolineae bacterium]